ncbi:MAG: SRPBCC family protein [Schumannella sp.]
MASSARAEGYAPAPAKRAFEFVTGADPVRYYPKFGPLPAVVRVEEVTGAWDAPGQSRKLILSDGGTVVERLTEVDAPRSFRYRLTDFTGSFSALVAYAEADWDFVLAPEGTRIRWRYTFHAQPKRGWIVRLIVRLFWARYMRRVLAGLLADI